MTFCDFLPAEAIRIAGGGAINSRKKVLETLAGLLVKNDQSLDPQTVFHHLIEREKLSSTALGNGTAVPHCRVSGLQSPQAALLRVSPGIDYDAPDQIPVTLFFALLVPEDAIEEHLKILAKLAETLNDENVRQNLNQAAHTEQILSIMRAGADE